VSSKYLLLRLLACSAVAVALLAGCVSPDAASPDAASPDAADDIRSAVSPGIDAFVAQRMEARGVPGVSVAVVRAGRTIQLAGYGRADSSGSTRTINTRENTMDLDSYRRSAGSKP